MSEGLNPGSETLDCSLQLTKEVLRTTPHHDDHFLLVTFSHKVAGSLWDGDLKTERFVPSAKGVLSLKCNSPDLSSTCDSRSQARLFPLLLHPHFRSVSKEPSCPCPPADRVSSSSVPSPLLFSVLWWSVTCAQCGPGTGECTSTPTTCTNSESCFSTKEQFNNTPTVQSILQKGCSSTCQQLSILATLGDKITFGYGQKCCNTDNCNQADFQVARKSSDPNGIVCPACYSETDSICKQTSLACQGEEKRCVVFTGSDGKQQSVFGMGCATETACNLKDVETINNVKIRTFCTNVSSGSPQLMSIISSILTALFLLTVLL
ncbi:uncharacterized protein LOC141581170 [Saimiri boliviensis]|uniref:uncharacterized protein LOC141581170 n=1 Tax=Saimiri boliviensis TaxID=27679 RepID=UPI003D773F18